MRIGLWLATLGVAAASLSAPARAQITPADPAGDPVVARVNGDPIHLSDVSAAAQALPQELRGMPPAMLFPLLIDQMISQRALTASARTSGLDKDPSVQRQDRAAEEQVLQNALIQRELEGRVTEASVRAKYDAEIANTAGEAEVHARHILVTTETDARAAITALKGGADFATLARERSTGPGAQQGGDLGFFKRTDMVPEFAEAAFALETPGQITETPVHSPFGWHVIQLVERRTSPPPSFDEVKDELRQKMLEENVQAVVQKIRDAANVERFNLDGTPLQR